MGNGVNVKQVQTLADMKNALSRFGAQTRQSLDHIEGLLRQVTDELQRKLLADQRELERCIENVRYARNGVENCEAQEDDDYTPDCSNEYSDLQWAQKERHAADRRLNETRKWRSRVERQIDEYRRMAARTKNMASGRVGQAKAMLNGKIGDIETYMRITADPGQIPNAGADVQHQAMDSGGYSSAGAVLAGAGSDQAGLTYSGTNGAWNELGIRHVELNNLPDIEGIVGESDFKKVPMKDMEAGLKRYQEIRKVMDKGEGNSKDYWAEVDRKMGLSYPNGYQRIYEAFYGSEPIRITKDGGTYTIENGRHRVWLAKQMGIRELPASVVERKRT